MPAIKVEILEGPQKGKLFTFNQFDTIIVGRSKNANLQLTTADGSISRSHCKFEFRSEQCVVSDLASKNGTIVNGKSISSKTLNTMDVIKIGDALIRVTIEKTDSSPVFCRLCGIEIVNVVSYNNKSNTGSPLCADCMENELDTMEKADFNPDSRIDIPALKTFLCNRCSKDVSERANFDGAAFDFLLSLYLCPNCTNTLENKTQSFEYDDIYATIGELGRGGMGIVYKAVHRSTGRVCAIKKIHPSALDDPKRMKLFEREMAVQSEVIHPNLIAITDKDAVGSTYYFVTEFLPGGDVLQLMKNTPDKCLSPKSACSITVEILKGLNALHSRGFIHRDIKPSNILLSLPNQDGSFVAKICDYGLAKSFEKAGESSFDITRTHGGFAGSLMYMSPELIKNYKYSKPPVDVYAAAVTLYFMLTGKYTVNIPADIAQKMAAGDDNFQRHPVDIVLEDRPVPILQRRADIPEALAAIVDKAVTKDIEESYQDANSLRFLLEKVMEKEGWK
ncbi:MAG: serine/threonine-protein kinase [Nitrospirae bacterium YQR-1]